MSYNNVVLQCEPNSNTKKDFIIFHYMVKLTQLTPF